MTSEKRLMIAIGIIVVVMLTTYLTQRTDAFNRIKEALGIQQEVNGANMAVGSQQQAVDVCQRATRADLGASLQQMYVDSLANRYNASNQSYSIFINVVIKGAEREDNFVRCDVSAVTQEMLEYTLTVPGFSWNFFN